MSEPFIGQITLFGGNFAPRGYAMCNGQLLSISQNQALFSLIGTTYGGNGQTNFALPNLQSRVAVGQGTRPGSFAAPAWPGWGRRNGYPFGRSNSATHSWHERLDNGGIIVAQWRSSG